MLSATKLKVKHKCHMNRQLAFISSKKVPRNVKYMVLFIVSTYCKKIENDNGKANVELTEQR